MFSRDLQIDSQTKSLALFLKVPGSEFYPWLEPSFLAFSYSSLTNGWRKTKTIYVVRSFSYKLWLPTLPVVLNNFLHKQSCRDGCDDYTKRKCRHQTEVEFS